MKKESNLRLPTPQERVEASLKAPQVTLEEVLAQTAEHKALALAQAQAWSQAKAQAQAKGQANR